jgi:DNA-binding NtrC family response regulator
VITGNGIDSAIDALRRGALDYLTKPVDQPRLRSVLAHVSRAAALRAEVASLRGELRELGRFGPLIGRSKAMQEVYDLIARVARPTSA